MKRLEVLRMGHEEPQALEGTNNQPDEDVAFESAPNDDGNQETPLKQYWGGQKMPSEDQRLSFVKEMLEGRNRLDHIMVAAAAAAATPHDAAAAISPTVLPPPPAGFMTTITNEIPISSTSVSIPESLVAYSSLKNRVTTHVTPYLLPTEVDDSSSSPPTTTFDPASVGEAFMKAFDSTGLTTKWGRGIRLSLSEVPSTALAPETMGILLAPSRDYLPPIESYPPETLEGIVLHLEDLNGKARTEVVWSEAEEIMELIRKAVQKVDRVLPLAVASQHAQRILRAIPYSLKVSQGLIHDTLGHLFDCDHQDGKFNVEARLAKQRTYHNRIALGVRHWTHTYFGLGVIVEPFLRAMLYRHDAPGLKEVHDDQKQPVSTSINGEPVLASFLCGCSHSFPLRSVPCGNDEYEDVEVDNAFVDAASDMDQASEDNRVLQSLKDSSLVVRLRLGKKGSSCDLHTEGLDGGDSREVMENEAVRDHDDSQEGSQVRMPLRVWRGLCLDWADSEMVILFISFCSSFVGCSNVADDKERQGCHGPKHCVWSFPSHHHRWPIRRLLYQQRAATICRDVWLGRKPLWVLRIEG